jgi:copper(I)-binding protein
MIRVRRPSGVVWVCLAAIISAEPALYSRAGQGSSVVVRDAWVRESTASRTVSAAYLQIDNRTSFPVKLVGVRVDGAGVTALHTVTRDPGQVAMRAITEILIPARSTVALAPGGTHVMLLDVKPPLVRGTTVKMTLTFDTGQTATVAAVVRPLSATSAR